MLPSRQRELIDNAIGPAPWYWKTFPAVEASSGQEFEWRYHSEKSELPYLVTLGLAQEAHTPRLALNTYCRAFHIPPKLFGIWCPEPRSVRLLCFDPDQLKAFSFVDIVGWFKQSTERVYSATEPLAEFEISSSLREGAHKVEVPEPFRSLDELLLLTSYPARTRDDAAAAVYVLYPRAGLVEVLPQKWFTPNQYDVGRQWISRVARDPETHRIVGEAVRVGNFELAEDGKQVERWLSQAE
ncbi:MAG TPA: hypothetical protein VKT29_06830 [Terriglobales bacterium]|nr:hypothetical protein [Terriglobales bacterium]